MDLAAPIPVGQQLHTERREPAFVTAPPDVDIRAVNQAPVAVSQAPALPPRAPGHTAVPTVPADMPSTATSTGAGHSVPYNDHVNGPHPGTTANHIHPAAHFDNTPPASQPVTATMDPNKPSSESAPVALPTNPATHPAEQREALRNEHPKVVQREVEKTKAEARELKGEKPKGTIVHGMEDDRLYAMLRRFDTQINHVLHPATNLPPIEPDLRVSTLPNLPSHSDTLKSNLERVIAAVGPSSIRGAREAQRMCDWSPQERIRTAAFCTSYFICWVFGYTLAGVCAFFAVVICFPETRRWLFPAVAPPPFTPPSATDPTNQKGDESLLGISDSKTIHRSKAEQAEEQAFEAASLLQAYTTRLIFDGRKRGKAAGNAEVGEKEEEESSSDDEDHVKHDPAGQGLQTADAVIGGQKIKAGEELSEKQKKKVAAAAAKKKRDAMVGQMTKATETGLGALADTIERLTNALSPPTCYPDRGARFKMAGAFIVPPALLLTFVPAWMFGRIATFGFGVGFWGYPILIRAAKKFVELVPNWQELLDIRNSILSGVPTDAQLTLHLLRVAEALENPLPRPPAPPLAGTPKEAIKDTSITGTTEEDDAEMEEADEQGGAAGAMTKAKVKTKAGIKGAFRSMGKKMAGIGGDVSVDGAKKHIGSKIDKVVFGVNVEDDGTNHSFPAKLDGVAGHIIIEGRNDVLHVPQISFVPTSGRKAAFVRSIDDIVEIKKAHVTVTRMALGWVSGADVEGLGLTVRFKRLDQQIAESVAQAPKEDGETSHFTTVGRREELFVRLISMGRQRWEVL